MKETGMKERGMIFNGEQVRAILDGRKTQARWPLKPQPGPLGVHPQMAENGGRYGTVGDRIWVRETWGLMCYHDPTDWCEGGIAGVSESELRERYSVEHRANWKLHSEAAHWRPSIHMPRWASCITLEITGVRVERVQDITEEDAKAEGVEQVVFLGETYWKLKTPVLNPGGGERIGVREAKVAFQNLWDSIYNNWDANPWVWAYSFRRVK